MTDKSYRVWGSVTLLGLEVTWRQRRFRRDRGMRVSGFTILRNGVRFAYPFEVALRRLSFETISVSRHRAETMRWS